MKQIDQAVISVHQHREKLMKNLAHKRICLSPPFISMKFETRQWRVLLMRAQVQTEPRRRPGKCLWWSRPAAWKIPGTWPWSWRSSYSFTNKRSSTVGSEHIDFSSLGWFQLSSASRKVNVSKEQSPLHSEFKSVMTRWTRWTARSRAWGSSTCSGRRLSRTHNFQEWEQINIYGLI